MISHFNEEAEEILIKAKLEMLELRHPYVGTEHLVLAILHTKNELSDKLANHNLTYSRFKKDKVLASVCEVSSQALQYHRTDNLKFDYGVYLNLSPDHISPTEHHSFNEYKEAKKLLLKQNS